MLNIQASKVNIVPTYRSRESKSHRNQRLLKKLRDLKY